MQCARWAALTGVGLGVAACGARSRLPVVPVPATRILSESLPPSRSLPPVPPVLGPLAIRVMYPAPDAVLQIRDSSFLFGTAGSGEARVTVNGQPARVWPNGAWLAYVALPLDSVVPVRIEARTPADSAMLDYPVRRLVPDAGRRTVGAAWGAT